MRNPSYLSYHDLQRIVQSIQGFLYIDLDDAGREVWEPDREWSGGDVCEHVAHVLSLHDLVPMHREMVAGEEQQYILDHLDGPMFRRQRQLLLTLVETSKQGKAYAASRADQDLLNGLVNLTDVIADQAHDNYRIDCLLEADSLCDCEKPGYFCSGIPGLWPMSKTDNSPLTARSNAVISVSDTLRIKRPTTNSSSWASLE